MSAGTLDGLRITLERQLRAGARPQVVNRTLGRVRAVCAKAGLALPVWLPPPQPLPAKPAKPAKPVPVPHHVPGRPLDLPPGLRAWRASRGCHAVSVAAGLVTLLRGTATEERQQATFATLEKAARGVAEGTIRWRRVGLDLRGLTHFEKRRLLVTRERERRAARASAAARG